MGKSDARNFVPPLELDANPLFRTTASSSCTTPARLETLADTTASVPQYPKAMTYLDPTSHCTNHWLVLINGAMLSTRPHSKT